MNVNKFFYAKLECLSLVQMLRNHIAEKHFISKLVWLPSNSHERYEEDAKYFNMESCSWSNTLCFKTVITFLNLKSTVPKVMSMSITFHDGQNVGTLLLSAPLSACDVLPCNFQNKILISPLLTWMQLLLATAIN